MFWDLRTRGLEAQALEPLKALEDMRGDAYPEDRAFVKVVRTTRPRYPEDQRLFAARVRRHIADRARATSSMRSPHFSGAVPRTRPFDRYLRGDSTAIHRRFGSRGMERFQSVGCVNCHNGPMFSDFTAHVLAVPDNRKLTASDAGVSQSYAFRTPSLAT